jgi:hypothetical protein
MTIQPLITKIIKLVSGEELCCTIPTQQLKEPSNLLRLQSPMLIKYVPQISEIGVSDYIALVKWISFTNDEIVTIPKDKILTICNASNAFDKRYHVLVKTAKLMQQPLPDYIEKDLDDSELDKLVEDIKEKDRLKKKLKDFVDLAEMPSKKLH